MFRIVLLAEKSFLRDDAGQIGLDTPCGTSLLEVNGMRTQTYLSLVNMRNLRRIFGVSQLTISDT